MESKDIIYELKTKRGLLQEELAEKVFVTRPANFREDRQAVNGLKQQL